MERTKRLTGVEELKLVFGSIDDPKIADRVRECYEEAFDKFCYQVADVLEGLIVEWKLDSKQEDSIHKISSKVIVTDSEGNVVTELVEDKYITNEMLEALKGIEE